VDLPDGVISQDAATPVDQQLPRLPTRTQRITLRPYESFVLHLTTQ
jgi:trehalose-6-phosphate hydrolase